MSKLSKGEITTQITEYEITIYQSTDNTTYKDITISKKIILKIYSTFI